MYGRRVGEADCSNLSIYRIASGRTGPAPFNKAWSNASGETRQEIRFINHLMSEQENFDRSLGVNR
jgi:hypothetical protein